MERIRVGEKVLSGDIVVNVGDDVFKVDLSSGNSVKLKKEIYTHISKRDKDIKLDMSIILAAVAELHDLWAHNVLVVLPLHLFHICRSYHESK